MKVKSWKCDTIGKTITMISEKIIQNYQDMACLVTFFQYIKWPNFLILQFLLTVSMMQTLLLLGVISKLTVKTYTSVPVFRV